MKAYRKILSFLLAVLLIAGAIMSLPSAAAEETNPDAEIMLTAQCIYGYSFEVLEQVNDLRASQGLKPLKMNPQMLEDAMQRSSELAVKFSHTRPDGSACFTVNSEMLGENIAVGQSTPAAVMQSWVNSPGHYANIMTSYYDSIGIGCVVHNGVIYWTQIFGISDTEGAETSDEVTEKDFSVNLGDNVYTVEMILPETMFAGDRGEIKIQGENSDYRPLFRLNNEDFTFTSSSPEVLIATGDEIIALSPGTATITATSPAMTVSATVEVVEFSKGESRQCGDNIFWDYKDHTLTLSGTGRMYDYDTKYMYYEIISTDVPWTDGFGSVEKLVVGEGITNIGSCAFTLFYNLKDIELPLTLKEIGESAFAKCQRLTEVTLPENLETLDEAVFVDCYNLKSVSIPEGVRSLPAYTFESCYSLESVKLPESLETIGTGVFSYCDRLKSVNIPEGIRSIGYSAFYGCEILEDITIPYGVAEIYSGTFGGCYGLKSLKVKNPVLRFGAEDMFSTQKDDLTIYGYKNSSADLYSQENSIAFVPFDAPSFEASVSDLRKVYDGVTVTEDLPIIISDTPDEYSVRYSEGESFDFDTSFESVEALAERYATGGFYDADKTYLTNSGKYPISYCIYSEGYNIVTGTAYIEIEKATPKFSFEKDFVEIPYHTKSYNYGVVVNPLKDLGFINAYDVEFTSDDLSVAKAESGGYVYAKGIGECTITATYKENENSNAHSISFKLSTYPVGNYQIGDFVFSFKEDRTATLFDYYGEDTVLTVPTEALGYDIKEISHGAFYGASFEEVNVPEGITHIGTSAFLSCTDLRKVNLSDTVSTIDEGAFTFCTALSEITIPDSVTSIMDKAFMGCNSMNSVVIPSTVKYIGENAFGYNQYFFSGDLIKNEQFIIYGHKDTAAEDYAKENGFKFVDLDAPPFELGDVNRDGAVNIKDATAIQKKLAGLISLDEEQMFLADFNEDGNVNIKDATQIQKRLAGLI